MADAPKSARSIKGSRTEKNLLTAFAGEAQARNRYTYFAKQAKKDGFVLVSGIFTETAEQELVHAKRFFSFLEGGEVEIAYSFPAGVIGTTRDNLLAAAEGEHHEYTTMYPGFAAVADEEGFPAVASCFRMVANAETFHERRYRALVTSLDAGLMFRREAPVTWRCLHCSYTHQGLEAPQLCPACLHPQAHFEVACLSW